MEGFCHSNNTSQDELEMVMDQLNSFSFFLPVISSTAARALLQPALWFLSPRDRKQRSEELCFPRAGFKCKIQTELRELGQNSASGVQMPSSPGNIGGLQFIGLSLSVNFTPVF